MPIRLDISPQSRPPACGQRRSALALAALALLAALLVFPPLAVRAAGVVSNCNDSGARSLRDAIATAPGATTVTFQPGLNCSGTGAGPITLTSGTLTIGTNPTIDGTGATITVDGNNAVTVFVVNSGVTANLVALTIQHGDATSGGGGGIQNAGTLTVTNSTLSHNLATNMAPGPNNGRGGAIVNGGTLTVVNSTLSSNWVLTASYSYGGAIYNAGMLTVTGSTFSGNNASTTGGLITYGDGGGIYNTGAAILTNSTFNGNGVAGGSECCAEGGGIFNSGGLALTNVTLSGNTAETGGGINTSTAVSLTGTIVANSGSGADLFVTASGSFTGNHNLVDDSTFNLLSGSNNIVANPQLGPLGNNGGPTQTIPLLPGSPAIDAGGPSSPASRAAGGAEAAGGGVRHRGIRVCGTAEWAAAGGERPGPAADRAADGSTGGADAGPAATAAPVGREARGAR